MEQSPISLENIIEPVKQKLEKECTFSDFTIKEELQDWGLEQKGQKIEKAEDLFGKRIIVKTVTFQTSPVKNVFMCKTGEVVVETESSSFYKLGVPQGGFALSHIPFLKDIGLA